MHVGVKLMYDHGGKMEVPVWYGDVRETERDEICYFGEWEMEEWQDSEIWYFRNCLCPTA